MRRPATTAGWDSLWARLDPSPSCPFLSDGQLQAWQCLYNHAGSGLHLIKPCLIVKGRGTKLGRSLTLFVSSISGLKKIQGIHTFYFPSASPELASVAWLFKWRDTQEILCTELFQPILTLKAEEHCGGSKAANTKLLTL